MKPELVICHEWIGLEVEVVDSPNPCEIGIKGKVVDETKNTLKILTEKGLKTVVKKGRVFRVKFAGKVLDVKGDLINFRPEERIKKGLILLRRGKVRRW